MLPVVSGEALRAFDQKALELGVPPLLLMESAGRSAAQEIKNWLSDVTGLMVVGVCGRGGNGGDALCALRFLGLWGARPKALVLGEPSGPAAEELRALAASFPQDVVVVEGGSGLGELEGWLSEADLILDGILGLGLQGPARGVARQAIELLGKAKRKVVAIDLPSGLSPDSGRIPGPSVRADLTLAMAALKPCHLLPPAAELCGEVRVVEVAYPPGILAELDPLALVLSDEACSSLLPKRWRFGHKGTFGRVLVVAGSVGMAGAAALCAEGALRAGAGLVHVVTPDPVFPIVASLIPEALVHPGPASGEGTFAPEAAEEVLKWADGADVVVVGPGLGRTTGAMEVVRALFTEGLPRLTVDADGLYALAHDPALLAKKHGELILTPHPGEFARLVGKDAEEVASDKIRWAKGQASEWQSVLVLKGPPTAIADPEGRVFLNTTGNTALAHGGSGDVLAGMIGGLWAGGIPALAAACLGAFAHGRAAEILSLDHSPRAILPSEILSAVPTVFSLLERLR